MRDRVSLETVSVSLLFGIGSMAWKVDLTERKAREVLKAASPDVGASRD